MNKYYVGLPYLLIGILAAAVYTAIDLTFSGSVRITMIALVVLGVPGFAAKSLVPVKPWSVFTVNGSVIKEDRLFEKDETRQADLASDDMKLYKWEAANGLWLIASTEELASMDAAKASYKQKKAVMVPVNQVGSRMKARLEPWADQAKAIG